MSTTKPLRITMHVYTKQGLSNKCVWCRHLREMHADEFVKDESGKFQKVAVVDGKPGRVAIEQERK